MSHPLSGRQRLEHLPKGRRVVLGRTLALEALESRQLLSVDLIKNINPSALSNQSYSLSAGPGSAIFYDAPNAVGGVDLYQNSATARSSKFVERFQSLSNLTMIGSTLYFTADDGNHGNELWKSDGTAAGTTLVADIHPGTADSHASNLTANGSTLYFTADDGNHGNELWKSDGTAAGTKLIADIHPGTAGSLPQNLLAVGPTLYFTADDGVHGRELWRSNGNRSTTILVSDLNPGSGDGSPDNIVAIGSTLYFTADDGTHGTELWQSHGTGLTTTLVMDLNPGSSPGIRTTLTVSGSSLYFSANDGTHGNELWTSDGSKAGTRLLVDINPGDGSSDASNLTVVGSSLYFTATDGSHGPILWASDGTINGTQGLALLQASNTASGDGLNHGPVFIPMVEKVATVGQPLAVALNAIDPDPGQTLRFSLEPGAPAGTTINAATGLLNLIPRAVGNLAIKVRVTDNGNPALTSTQNLSVSVSPANRPPVFHTIQTPPASVGQPLTVNLNATDPDPGQTLHYSLDPGAPTGATINPSTGQLTFTPQTAGTVTLLAWVTDNGSPASSVSQTVTFTIVPANRPPVFHTIQTPPASVGQPLTVNLNATDPDPGQTLHYSLDPGAPTGATINPSTGQLTFTPQTAGTVTIQVRVTDSGNPAMSTTQTMIVNVAPLSIGSGTVIAPVPGALLKTISLDIGRQRNPARAERLSNYRLVEVATNKLGNNHSTRGTLLTLDSAQYHPDTGLVVLTPQKDLTFNQSYRIRVRASQFLTPSMRTTSASQNRIPRVAQFVMATTSDPTVITSSVQRISYAQLRLRLR